MAKKKSRRAQRRASGTGSMPAGGAGLIRFYNEESSGVKVGPIATMLLAGGLVGIVVVLWLWYRGIIPFLAFPFEGY